MADPIVIELQRLASDKSQDIGDLLRKALIVATKLRIEDFKTWINNELNGFESRSEVPKYRHVVTQLKAINQFRGGLDLMFIHDPELAEIITELPLMWPISELQALVTPTNEMFHLSLHPGEMKIVMKLFQISRPIEIVREGSRLSIVGVIDAVRNTILEWSLRLEEQGIMGHGMTFTAEEKAIAMKSQNIHIGSFQGVLGNVADSTVTQTLNMSIKAGDFNSLKQQLMEAGIAVGDIESLKQALDTDPRPASPTGFGPKVSAWIGTMMSKAASGAWKITLDTAGKLIPTAIAAYYGLKS